ncbi:MAG: GNAT family N-acetyltransferase [Anaerolineae bacterium]
MSPNFQLASPTDLEILLPLMGEYYNFEGIVFDDAKARRAMGGLLADARYGLAWIIRVDNAVAGYMVVCFGYGLESGGRDAFIDELYLRPSFRGQGIGTQAMKIMIEACRIHGVHVVYLEVGPENELAIRYYAKAGFIERGFGLMACPIEP